MRLPWHHWKNTLAQLGLKVVRRRDPHRKPGRRLTIEGLEPRLQLTGDVNQPPFLSLIGLLVADENTTTTIGLSATDPDQSFASLDFQLEPGAPGFVTLNGDNLILSPSYDDCALSRNLGR
jgi:hypothetical protein